jgi:MFS family permease
VAAIRTTSSKQARNLPFNFVVNMIDGGFFGLGLGFASLSTVIPLFVSNLTTSAVLIELIPAIHVMGWQLPQIFTAHRVARQKRYKPMVMFFTIHERLPFLGLAAISWFIPGIGPKIALILTFMLLVWQGFGGGFTANAWQNMILKIIPRERWGVFYGVQSAAGNLLASIGSAVAGIVLQNNNPQSGFTLCFLFAVGAFIISYGALFSTREEETDPVTKVTEQKVFWSDVRTIFLRDGNFRWFVAVRILGQLGTVGFALYTVYVVRYYGVDEATAGILTAVLMITQTLFNPIMGWLGDRWSHRWVMAIGMGAAAMSAAVAGWAPSMGWFYLSYALAGIAYVATWTIAMAMTLEFGQEHEKPAYIGMANTLIAPTALISALMGGWLADAIGYRATFMATAAGAILCVLVICLLLHDQPRPLAVVE